MDQVVLIVEHVSLKHIWQHNHWVGEIMGDRREVDAVNDVLHFQQLSHASGRAPIHVIKNTDP